GVQFFSGLNLYGGQWLDVFGVHAWWHGAAERIRPRAQSYIGAPDTGADPVDSDFRYDHCDGDAQAFGPPGGAGRPGPRLAQACGAGYVGAARGAHALSLCAYLGRPRAVDASARNGGDFSADSSV